MKESSLKFKPKFEKILELLLYLAHKRPGADHYQAVKFLYLADKEHLNKYGRPITYEKYCAMQYGPVASNALDLIKEKPGSFKKFGISELPFELEHLDKVIIIRRAKREVNYDLFSKSDLEVFDFILKEYGQKSFGELYNITHADFAYRNARGNEKSTKSPPMSYEDMIEESPKKSSFIKDFSPIADRL